MDTEKCLQDIPLLIQFNGWLHKGNSIFYQLKINNAPSNCAVIQI
jgi:hypothetical protein